MNKFSWILLSFIFVFFSSVSIYGASDPSITIIGFENSDPITHTVPGSNSRVDIEFTGAIQFSIPTTPSFTVDGQLLSSGFGYLQIAKGGTITVTRPSITDDVLENVVLWCSSVSASVDIQPGWSTFGQAGTFTDEYYGITAVTNLTELGDKAYGYFPLVNNYGDNNLTDFITAYNDEALETRAADINCIRFTVANSTSDPLNLYGIYVYTSLKSTSTDSRIIDDNKTPLKVTYYDLTGRPVTPDRKGFVIRRTLYSDGSLKNEKIYKH